MSGWNDICYELPTHFDWILCLADLWPISVSCGLFWLTLYIQSVFLWILWIVTCLDYALSLTLRYSIQQASPHPYLAHHAWEMPASASQLMLCLGTVTVCFVLLYNMRPQMWLIVCVYFAGALGLYARLHQGINTPQQLIAGALVGYVEGLVYTFLWHFIAYPYMDYMMDWIVFRYWGIKDYLMRSRRDALSDPLQSKIITLRDAFDLQSELECKIAILQIAREIIEEDPRFAEYLMRSTLQRKINVPI